MESSCAREDFPILVSSSTHQVVTIAPPHTSATPLTSFIESSHEILPINQSRNIYLATASCREAFEGCLATPGLMYDKWAENRLLDFNLWASGVGAFARPAAGLDHRLETRPDARAVVIGLLATLNTLLHSCTRPGASAGGLHSQLTTLQVPNSRYTRAHNLRSLKLGKAFMFTAKMLRMINQTHLRRGLTIRAEARRLIHNKMNQTRESRHSNDPKQTWTRFWIRLYSWAC
jgi:hypothetical protein